MVLFLNYLPLILAFVIAYIGWHYIFKVKPTTHKRILTGLFGVVAALFLMHIATTAVSNAYIGKADNLDKRLPTPTVEEVVAAAEEAPPIRDIQRKPVLTSKEDFDAMTEWRKIDLEAKTNQIERRIAEEKELAKQK